MSTHRERMQTCLAGGEVNRTPIALWRHFPVDDQDPGLLAASTLDFQKTYDFDIVKVTPASSFAVKGWGVEDEWAGDAEGSRRNTKRIIHQPADWEKLMPLDLKSHFLADQLACLRLVKEGLDLETPVIQTVFNPLSQAKNLAGNELLLHHLREYPQAVMKGLDTIAKTTARFIEAVRDIGVDGIFYAVQHAQADLLSLAEYKTLGLPADLIALEGAKDLWCNMLHLHGKDVYFSLLQSYNFQAVNWHDRETPPSLAEAQNLFSGALCGGLRQDSIVHGSESTVKEEAADAISQTAGWRFILGTGCVVPITASHRNLVAARRSVDPGFQPGGGLEVL